MQTHPVCAGQSHICCPFTARVLRWHTHSFHSFGRTTQLPVHITITTPTRSRTSLFLLPRLTLPAISSSRDDQLQHLVHHTPQYVNVFALCMYLLIANLQPCKQPHHIYNLPEEELIAAYDYLPVRKKTVTFFQQFTFCGLRNVNISHKVVTNNNGNGISNKFQVGCFYLLTDSDGLCQIIPADLRKRPL